MVLYHVLFALLDQSISNVVNTGQTRDIQPMLGCCWAVVEASSVLFTQLVNMRAYMCIGNEQSNLSHVIIHLYILLTDVFMDLLTGNLTLDDLPNNILSVTVGTAEYDASRRWLAGSLSFFASLIFLVILWATAKRIQGKILVVHSHGGLVIWT